MALHPDKESFNEIWKDLIFPEICAYTKRYDPYLYTIEHIENEIWNSYILINERCKRDIMRDDSKKLDRHKVAACYMMAICSVKPLKIQEKIMEKDLYFLANEIVAITVGLSLVTAYAKKSIKNDNGLDENKKIII